MAVDRVDGVRLSEDVVAYQQRAFINQQDMSMY